MVPLFVDRSVFRSFLVWLKRHLVSAGVMCSGGSSEKTGSILMGWLVSTTTTSFPDAFFCVKRAVTAYSIVAVSGAWSEPSAQRPVDGGSHRC